MKGVACSRQICDRWHSVSKIDANKQKSPIFNIVLMIVHTAMFLIFQITVHCAVGFLQQWSVSYLYLYFELLPHSSKKSYWAYFFFFGIVNKRKSPWLTIRNLCIFFSFREEQQQPGFLLQSAECYYHKRLSQRFIRHRNVITPVLWIILIGILETMTLKTV